MSNNNPPHIAQRFVWWATGIGLICAGFWSVFVYFDKKTAEVEKKIEVPVVLEEREYLSNVVSVKIVEEKPIDISVGDFEEEEDECAGDWRYQPTKCQVER